MKLTRRKFLGGLLVAIGAVFLDAFWIEKKYWKAQEEYLRGATSNDFSLSFVQISDLHLQQLNTTHHHIADYIERVWKPDFICLTGDMIDKAQNIGELEGFLQLLNPTTPKYAILGNWEYWGKVDIKALERLYAQYNTILLINQQAVFAKNDKKILITGCDDWLGGQAKYDFDNENMPLTLYHLCLTHCPIHYDQVAKSPQKPDMVLSGHTHGGQLNLFGFTPFLPKGSGQYVKGWYHQHTATPLYVSRGIGTSIAPFRLGSRAEITCFRLKV